jgi:hypothetical protein
MSHQSSEFYPDVVPPWQTPPAPIITKDGLGNLVTNYPAMVPWGVWISKYWLDVVDFADPALPTLRKPVNLPGSLLGLSHNGALLYTSGYHYNGTNYNSDGFEFVDALAYDGVSATAVDSLALPQTWPRTYTLNSGTLYVAWPDGTNTTSKLASYKVIETTGKFSEIKSVKSSVSISELAVVGNALVARSNYSLQILEPSQLSKVAEGRAPGCIWLDTRKADGTLSGGFWFPMGDYGLLGIKP